MDSAKADVAVEWMVEKMVDLLDLYMVAMKDTEMVWMLALSMVVSLVVKKVCLSVDEMADY